MNDRIQEIRRRHTEEQVELDATAGTYVRQEHQDRAYLLSEVERLQTENERLSNEMDSMMIVLEDRSPYAAQKYWEYLLNERTKFIEALEWTRKRFDEEWTYELGTGEVVDEILTKFDSALFRLKDKP